jgi:hypothetical protein
MLLIKCLRRLACFIALPIFIWGQAKVTPATKASDSSINFTCTVTAPPNKSVSLLHGIGQRPVINLQSVEMLGGLSRLVRSQDFVLNIPAELRDTIGNGSPIAESDEPTESLLQPMMELANRSKVERGKADTLVLINDSTLPGNVSGSELAVKTRFGSTTIPLDKVLALAGGGEFQNASRVFLRNGEIITGDIEAKNLVFHADNGLVFQLDTRQLTVLIMHTDPADGKPPPDVIAYVETHLGMRLAVQAKSPQAALEVATAWGRLSIPLADIDQLKLNREPQPVHRLALKDKSRLSVILRGGEMALSTTRFGAVKMMPAEIVGVSAARREAEKEDEPRETGKNPDAVTAPHFQLPGDNVVVGVFDMATIEIITSAGTTPVKTASLRNMEKAAELKNANSFQLAFADGTRLAGRLALPMVAIRTSHGVLEAPLGHILGYRNDKLKTKSEAENKGDPSANPK